MAAVRLLCLLRAPWPDWAGLSWAGLSWAGLGWAGWAGLGWDLLTLQRAALALPWHLGRGGSQERMSQAANLHIPHTNFLYCIPKVKMSHLPMVKETLFSFVKILPRLFFPKCGIQDPATLERLTVHLKESQHIKTIISKIFFF